MTKLRGTLFAAVDLEARGSPWGSPRNLVSALKAFRAVPFGAAVLLLPIRLFSRGCGRAALPIAVPLMGLASVAIVALPGVALRRCDIGLPPLAAALSSMVLVPPAAVPALPVAPRNLAAHFDLLALAAEPVDPEAFRNLARRECHGVARARQSAGGADLAAD